MSMFRIGGLASGMDIDTMVADLMKIERMPLIRLQQQLQIYEWKQEDYRNINTKLLELKNEAFNMALDSTYLSKTATSTDESAVTATATGDAENTSFDVTVTNLATVATNQSENTVSAVKGSQLSYNVTIDASNNSFLLTYNGTQHEIVLTEKVYDGTAGNTLSDLVNDIQAKIDAAFGSGNLDVFLTPDNRIGFRSVDKTDNFNYGITLNNGTNNVLDDLGFTDGASMEQIVPTKTIAELKSALAISDGAFDAENNFTFTVNGVEFTFDADTATLNDVINEVNSSEAAGVTMFYDLETDKISISTDQTGNNQAGAEISVSGEFIENALQIDEANEQGGQNATVTINGLETQKTSNTFEISGVIFTLTGQGSARVDVSTDTEGIFDKIQSFVELYNSTLEEVYSKLREEKYDDYPPLTEDQKEEMTEKEIELWEAKARSGLLSNDSILRDVVYDMRRAMYEQVEGLTTEYDLLSEIGIQSYSYEDDGKLYIDESKLKEAIEKDPESIMKLFANNSDSYQEKGVAEKLYEFLDEGIELISDKAGSSNALIDNSYLGKRIRGLNEQILEMEERLIEVESRYWNEFSIMESAINQMNAQSMWLSQQLMGS